MFELYDKYLKKSKQNSKILKPVYQGLDWIHDKNPVYQRPGLDS